MGNGSEELARWAKDICSVMNLRVAGIDYFASSIDGEDFRVIEVNHNPSLKGLSSMDHDAALEIWGKILHRYFAA